MSRHFSRRSTLRDALELKLSTHSDRIIPSSDSDVFSPLAGVTQIVWLNFATCRLIRNRGGLARSTKTSWRDGPCLSPRDDALLATFTVRRRTAVRGSDTFIKPSHLYARRFALVIFVVIACFAFPTFYSPDRVCREYQVLT